MAEELDERLDDEDKDGQVLVSILQFSRIFFLQIYISLDIVCD